MSSRKAIPAELKRRILVESGHRCAIPTCRFPTTELAHIEPYSKVKKHEYNNLIALCPNCHTRFDNGEIDKKSMIFYKNKVRFLSDRYSKYELNVLDYLRNHSGAVVFDYLMAKNLFDEELIEVSYAGITYGDDEIFLDNYGVDITVSLTEKGKKLLENWEKPDSSLTY